MKYIKIVVLGFVVILFVGCGGIGTDYKSYKNQISQSKKIEIYANYLIAKDLEVEKPEFPSKPPKPEMPTTKNLVKGKYEKINSFELRVAQEREKRVKIIKKLEKSYAKKVRDYNDEVKKLTDAYNNALATKRKNLKNIKINAFIKAYTTAYGKPYLDKTLKYDAESEIFYTKVLASKGGFEEDIAINVPIDRAEDFEKNVADVKVKIIFDEDNGRIVLKKIALKEANRNYIAKLSNTNFKSQEIRVAVNEGNLNLASTPLLSTSLDISESDYKIGAINYSTDPEIAALQKRKYLLERKNKKREYSQAKKEQLRQQKEALESQIALLQHSNGGTDDIAKLLKKAKSAKIDKHKWLFVVAIENYEYTDPVAYSANSAKNFVKVMQKRLGISAKNSRVLINAEATSGKIRHNLKDILSHVKKDDTIYFYYSGHGIPVPSQHNAPYLLAQDMSPEYVSDDARFKLQNIYKALSNSKAKKVVAFMDSCFSGGTDNQALIKGVAATRMVPKEIHFNEKKMVVISAGSGVQYSNKYDEKSNRLFSYYLMKGLIKNNSNVSRLYDYVKSNVAEKSYEMGSSYEQVPVYAGNIKMKL